MPFTPFHWGPSSWIGLILFKIFNFHKHRFFACPEPAEGVEYMKGLNIKLI